MTKSYIINKSFAKGSYNNWEAGIIAPKFTMKNFADELHYYLRIYLRKKKPFLKILAFIFLNAFQRILYTLGTNLTKIKFRVLFKSRY